MEAFLSQIELYRKTIVSMPIPAIACCLPTDQCSFQVKEIDESVRENEKIATGDTRGH